VDDDVDRKAKIVNFIGASMALGGKYIRLSVTD